ncbi:MAG: glycosyltransferase [Chloroflexi bacterium]|nr:MAG: glycosyltransferase [Chloroflexota bacterium]
MRSCHHYHRIKLEIIVLDDESGDNTQHLIKAFAHSGVRFVEGVSLLDGWLGKNNALQGLLDQASGSLILFADVDTRFSTNSITEMVAYMQSNSVDMISILPQRLTDNWTSTVAATLRQFWNIAGGTALSAASNAWMIRRDVIHEELKGFNNIPLSVRPEKAIASAVGADRYKFIVSTRQLGVYYEKKLSSQYETSIRIYQPDFGWHGVALRGIGLYVILMSYIYVVTAIVQQDNLLLVWSLTNVVLISIVNVWYLRKLRTGTFLLDLASTALLPIIIGREIILLIMSVAAYQFNSVTWKGRPVRSR